MGRCNERAAALILAGLCAWQLIARAQQTVAPDSPVVKDFEKRAAEYVKLYESLIG